MPKPWSEEEEEDIFKSISLHFPRMTKVINVKKKIKKHDIDKVERSVMKEMLEGPGLNVWMVC